MATASNFEVGSDQMNSMNLRNVWIGIAVGTAVGVGIALSRRKKSRWDSAKDIAHRVAGSSGEFADATRELVARIGTIYEESRRVVDDAAALWSHGRKLAGR